MNTKPTTVTKSYVIVEPSERLSFTGICTYLILLRTSSSFFLMFFHTGSPGGLVVPQSLKLTNTHTGVVFFKIKTTAPKKYCVRPNGGKLNPDCSTVIQSGWCDCVAGNSASC